MTQTSTKTGLKKISVKIRDAEVELARTGVALSTGFNRLGALLQTVFLSYSSSVT